MRKLLIIFSLILLTSSVSAQIGVHFSPAGKLNVYIPEPLEGAGGRTGDYVYAFGVNYLKPLKGSFELETGLEFTKFGIIQTPGPYPPFDMTQTKKSISMISVPVGIRLNFLKYFFINGAVLLDMELKSSADMNSQSGIGAMGGVAFKYDFRSGVSVYINPYFKAHSILSFSNNDYKQMLLESGARIGFMIQL
ncbi:hypothetical protein MASR2M69_19060 [Bacteroidota bacterium]